MDTEIMVETLPLLGVCNLCLNEGEVTSMLISSTHEGNKESYSDMLIKCFSIDVTVRKLGDTKRLICDTCITKLQDSVTFKQQVETSLKSLEETLKTLRQKEEKSSEDEVKDEIMDQMKILFDGVYNDQIDDDDEEEESTEHVKEEIVENLSCDDHDYNDDIDEDDDDTALNKVIKKIKKEDPTDYQPRKTRRKLTKGVVKISLKKTEFKETEIMLESGLFPFKIRKNRTFSCAICPENSTNLDDIKKHINEHSKTNLHLAFKKMLLSNVQRFYKTSTKLRCKICTTDISDYQELRQHIENCTRLKYQKWNNLPFKLEKDQLDCPVCKKTFLNYVNLNTHMNVHYPNYICENCGKAFASNARLRGHMRTHEIGSFPCRHCNAVFDRVTKRENHVSKEHKSGVRYACKRCNISLTSFYARQKHLAEVHNEELKRYKCKACPQSYITPGHLSSHVRRDHLNERNHKCDKCDLAFYTKNALKMHMIKHDGERIHSCHICHKSYQRKKTLREHMRIHNNDKRFVCPVCGRAFTQKCTLKGHLKVHERKIDLDDRIVQPLSI